MRHIFVLVIRAVAVSAIVAFFVAQPLSAQDTHGELEEFRGKLAVYYAELAEVYPYIVDAGGSPEPLEKITEAQQLIPELTTEELGVLREAISENPAFWDLPQIVRLYFGPEAQRLQATAQEAQGDSVSLLSHSCPAPASGGIFTGPQKHIQNEFAEKVLLLSIKAKAVALQALMEVVPEGVNAVVVGAWLIGEEAVIVAEGIVLFVEGKNAVNDECEEDNHRTILHDVVAPRVDTTVSSRASQTSLNAHDANIDADLVAHDAKIEGLIGGVQTTLDTTTEMKRVHLQVIELGDEREFLVLADEAGVPVNVEFIGVQYSNEDPVAFVDVTANTIVTVVKQGIHQVVIDPDEVVEDIDSAKMWEFRVEHNHGLFTHFGITLFIEDHDKNFGMGQ